MAETADAPRAPLTHARVFRIAFPIVLSNATVPILGVVDTAVVGQMGEAAPIGAVGIGAYRTDGRLLGLRLSAHGHGRPGEPGHRRGRPGRGDGDPVARPDDRRGRAACR